MIKKLRRKFIAIAMGSMAVVLILLIGGMNIVNFHTMVSDLDLRLDILSENNGSFPSFFDPAKGSYRNSDRAMLPENDASDIFDLPDESDILRKSDRSEMQSEIRSKNDFRHSFNNLSEESPFDTRFFTVTMKEDGTVITIDTGKIAAVSSTQATEYAQKLLASAKKSGFLEKYRYRVIPQSSEENDVSMYIFLYCERELRSFRNFLFSSVGVSILGMFMVFVLVLFFSGLMLKPVAESYDKQKRFITDASHELKTPLTIIDANTEVLEMETGENEWTKSIHGQVARLNSLTQKLVFLSRMDEGNTANFTMTDFSLSDAVEEMAKPFEAVAATGGKSLSLDIMPDLNMNGDEASIRQLVSLLMDNAMKYTPEKGEILLKLKQSGRNKILTVKNTAENLSAGKQDILFDRFYRAEASRNSKSGGFGIGLSVAQAIVLAHRGKISARSEDGKSLEIKIQFTC